MHFLSHHPFLTKWALSVFFYHYDTFITNLNADNHIHCQLLLISMNILSTIISIIFNVIVKKKFQLLVDFINFGIFESYFCKIQIHFILYYFLVTNELLLRALANIFTVWHYPNFNRLSFSLKPIILIISKTWPRRTHVIQKDTSYTFYFFPYLPISDLTSFVFTLLCLTFHLPLHYNAILLALAYTHYKIMVRKILYT